jgi:predicted metal-dependent hydrolase
MAILQTALESEGLEELKPDSGHEKYIASITHFSPIGEAFYMPARSRSKSVIIHTQKATTHVLAVVNHKKFQNGILQSRRIFAVKDWRFESVLNQFQRNKGWLDSEIERVQVASANGTYDLHADDQAMLLYAVERMVLGLTNGYISIGATSPEQYNSKSPTSQHNPALTAREVLNLIEEVCSDYYMPNIPVIKEHLEISEKGVSVARCMSRSTYSLMQKTTAESIQLNTQTIMLKSVILHELAHAIDVYEFGALAHGPTFIMILCELYHSYLGLDFENTYDCFVNSGLLVANPVYSNCFDQLKSKTQKHHKENYHTMKEQINGK